MAALVDFGVILFVLGICQAGEYDRTGGNDGGGTWKPATVLIAILARNKGHVLPYFLSYLNKLNYPKERISLWITSDHNIDHSIDVIEDWLRVHRHQYHSVVADLNRSSPDSFPGELGPAHWTKKRFSWVIQLREMALNRARATWADYFWALDSDVFITNPNTLRLLIEQRHVIAAPMLRSDGLYSNFWCGMTEEFYYKRTDDYTPILYRKNKGCFTVPMVHSSVLVDLRASASDGLTYDPDYLKGYGGPHDDIITFAISANMSGIEMKVCNQEIFGYVMMPLEKTDYLSYDLFQLTNLKIEVLVDGPPLQVDPILRRHVRTATYPPLKVDRTFMISLKRRPDRRLRMQHLFNELQLNVTTIDAVDGRLLTDDKLNRMGVSLMPGYEDPYHKRPMKRGEIGCFLSHYKIWDEVARDNYNIVMVLEDDVRFEPFFNQKMAALLDELQNLSFEWDLVYLGRKRLEANKELFVEGAQHLVWIGYSYWTLGYLLSSSGARKLIAQDPLKNVLPVDEYLPIMYDKQPDENWKSFYPARNLVALSVEPLLVNPMKYLYEEGYISDTEDSLTVDTTPNPEL